jgi:probable HAF family extracellular repeat protein
VKVVGTTVIGGTGIGSYAYRGFYWSSATKTMVSIGVIGAGSQSRANDVNSKGEVVGDSSTISGNGNNHALYWNPSRGKDNPLDLCPEWPLSMAFNINESGIVVGYVYSESTGNLPACWIPTSPNSGVYGPTVLLPRPSDAGLTNSGFGRGRYLAENGDIVGGLVDAGGVFHAVYWKNLGTSASPVYDVPTIIAEPSAGASSNAGIINSLSQIVGGWSASGSSGRPFGWNPGDAVATDLGAFSNNPTSAWGLNDLGQVAVLAPITVGTGTQNRAAIWLPQADSAYGLSAGLNLLTTPGGAGTLGGTDTRPLGLSTSGNGRGFTLNNNGQVVGFSTTSTGEYHAFIWDKVNKMRDLNSKTLTPDKATFAYLRDACGITDNGYIVGTGQTVTSKGKTYIHAYLLTPKP